jgi:hypothetical protein
MQFVTRSTLNYAKLWQKAEKHNLCTHYKGQIQESNILRQNEKNWKLKQKFFSTQIANLKWNYPYNAV